MAAPKVRNDVPNEIVVLLDEAIALVPGTDVEISILERYGSDKWKSRMIEVRGKLTEIRGRVTEIRSHAASINGD